MKPPRAALVTCAELPALPPDDRPLSDELVARGILVDVVAWDEPAADWRGYDAIVLRSTWDYHLKPAAFRAWLDRLEAAGAPLWNPPAAVRANADKAYLLELARAGVPIVPTELVRRGGSPGLSALLRARGWDEAVVKPAVSAGAFLTRRVSARRFADEAALEEVLGHSDALVQPLLPEIASEGEWSFVFLDGAFSHAVLKTVKAGDFRVQEHFGGVSRRVDAPAALLAAAERAVAAVPQPLLYARVDGIRRGTELLLMELELIEPSLFFGLAPGSAAKLADAIASRAARRASRAPSR